MTSSATERPFTEREGVTCAIGDIHGCLHKLLRLMDHCKQFAGDRPVRWVFVGDYVDRGPDSRSVINVLMAAQRECPDRVICLRGNHEAMMRDAARANEQALWLLNGGGATLASYGIEVPEDLPADHIDWISALPLSLDDGKRFFVHAGVNPSIPLDQQTEHDQIWIREPFLSDPRDYGRLIVHGHTPLPNGLPDLRRNRLNIDTAAVLGGPLTAAIFTDDTPGPVAFLTDFGDRIAADGLDGER